MKSARAAAETRRQHLQILLERLTGHADVIRQHLKERPHNYTLGFAAEAGVRDVLRQVLPQRLAVTSGFIRSTTGMLLVPPTSARVPVSPQTDIIIYDAMRACPLYSVEGIDVVAAPDVLGVLEIKDSGGSEGDLGLTQKGFEDRREKANKEGKQATDVDDGALEHILELARAAPRAFRGIVLIQGGHVDGARERLEFAKARKGLSPENVPHVIYGRALESKGDAYVAFLDSADDAVHFNAYRREGGGCTDALAAVLRLITGFFAAQGMTSASIATDLLPAGKRSDRSPEPLSLADGPSPPSLRDAIRAGHAVLDPTRENPSYEEMLKTFFNGKGAEQRLQIRPLPALGRDAAEIPTAGPRVTVSYLDGAETRTLASFFTMSTAGYLKCVDGPGGAPEVAPWWIYRESIDAYLMRVCELDATVFIEDDDPEELALEEAPAEDAKDGG